MKTKLFTYWQGKKPGYIKLCEQIIKNKTKDVLEYHFVNDCNVFDYITDDLPDNYFKIQCVAHKADYIRCNLLLENGGVWLDLDQILLSDLSEIVSKLNDYDYISYEWERNCPSIGMICVNKNNIVLHEWKQKMKALINLKTSFGWEELGYHLLHPILHRKIENNEIRYFGYNARESFSPLEWKEHNKFIENGQLNTSGLQSVMLYNSKFPEEIKNLSESDVLKQNYLLSRLISQNL